MMRITQCVGIKDNLERLNPNVKFREELYPIVPINFIISAEPIEKIILPKGYYYDVYTGYIVKENDDSIRFFFAYDAKLAEKKKKFNLKNFIIKLMHG